MRLRSILLSATAALVLAACGGSQNNYKIPVDSPLKPFEKPAEGDLTGENDSGSLTDPVEDEPIEDPMADFDDDDDADGGDKAPDAGKPDAAKPDAAPKKKAPAPAPKKKTR
jgi:hypothetical protein